MTKHNQLQDSRICLYQAISPVTRCSAVARPVFQLY